MTYTYEDYQLMNHGLKVPTTDGLAEKSNNHARLMKWAVPAFLAHYFAKSEVIRFDNIDELVKIWAATGPIAIRKRTERRYKNDKKNIPIRYFIGFLMERAVERHYGLPPFSFCDITEGSNVDKNLPDMREIGINIGVKGCQKTFFPLIPSNCGYANIICLIDDYGLNDKTPIVDIPRDVAILGLATSENISKYTSDAFVLSDDIETKSGFYGFDYLEPLPSLEELRKRFPWNNHA